MCAAQICLHKGFSESAAGEKTEELGTKKMRRKRNPSSVTKDQGGTSHMRTKYQTVERKGFM